MHCGNEFSYVWLWLKHWPKNQWLLDKIGIINFLVSKLSWTLVVAHKSFYLPLVQLCYLISSGSILRLHSSYTLTFHSSSPIRHSCLSIEKKKDFRVHQPWPSSSPCLIPSIICKSESFQKSYIPPPAQPSTMGCCDFQH